jgi:hypothetical protein
MDGLTVGEVSDLVSFAVTAMQFLFTNFLAFIFVGLLGDTQTAVS